MKKATSVGGLGVGLRGVGLNRSKKVGKFA